MNNNFLRLLEQPYFLLRDCSNLLEAASTTSKTSAPMRDILSDNNINASRSESEYISPSGKKYSNETVKALQDAGFTYNPKTRGWHKRGRKSSFFSGLIGDAANWGLRNILGLKEKPAKEKMYRRTSRGITKLLRQGINIGLPALALGTAAGGYGYYRGLHDAPEYITNKFFTRITQKALPYLPYAAGGALGLYLLTRNND